MTVRALAIDLDGTLLTADETVSPGNAAALREAMAAGVQVIVATARWYGLAERICDEFGITGPVIACSGAQVRVRSGGRDLLDVRLPADFTAELYRICDETRCVATFALDDDVLVKMDGEPDRSFMPPGMRGVAKLAEGPRELPRIGLIQGTETNRRIEEQLAPAFGGEVDFRESFSSRGKRILTLTGAGADKGRALRVACESLGIAPGEVAAFGDAENDLAMFAVAGMSVAMGQASDEVKAAASWVAPRHDEDGVAAGIRRVLGDPSPPSPLSH